MATVPHTKAGLQRLGGLQAAVLLGLLGLSIVAAAGMGHIRIPAAEVVRILAAGISGQKQLLAGIDELLPVVVTEVRLPRILTSAVVGGGLAVAGVAFQGILLNPLADPYTLGVSAGAAFGASLAIILNIGQAGAFSIPLFAFLGAVTTLLFVVYLSSASGGLSSNNLILSVCSSDLSLTVTILLSVR